MRAPPVNGVVVVVVVVKGGLGKRRILALTFPNKEFEVEVAAEFTVALGRAAIGVEVGAPDVDVVILVVLLAVTVLTLEPTPSLTACGELVRDDDKNWGGRVTWLTLLTWGRGGGICTLPIPIPFPGVELAGGGAVVVVVVVGVKGVVV